MKKLIPISVLSIMVLGSGCAPTNVVNTAQVYNPVDSVQEYTQRADRVTLSAGNAQETNIRVQEVDPWPRYVGDKHIAANAQVMADAAWRYRCGRDARLPLASIGTTTTTQGQASAAATAGGGRPGTDCNTAPQVQLQATTR